VNRLSTIAWSNGVIHEKAIVTVPVNMLAMMMAMGFTVIIIMEYSIKSIE